MNYSGRICLLLVVLFVSPFQVFAAPEVDIAAEESETKSAPARTTHSDPAGQGQYLKLSRAMNVISLLSPIRMRSAQYHQMRSHWPQSFKQMGFESEDMSDGETIAHVYLKNTGEITAKLMPSFGDEKFLSLRPRLVMAGSSMKWDCVTNLDPAIFRLPGAYPCRKY